MVFRFQERFQFQLLEILNKKIKRTKRFQLPSLQFPPSLSLSIKGRHHLPLAVAIALSRSFVYNLHFSLQDSFNFLPRNSIDLLGLSLLQEILSISCFSSTWTEKIRKEKIQAPLILA